MKYDVHLFAVVRVKFTGISAPNEKAAGRKAKRPINLHKILDRQQGEVGSTYATETEFEDQLTHLLVEPAGNGDLDVPKTAKCFEPFGKGDLTEVPFGGVSTHVAVVAEGGNVQSVVTNRPCQVVVLDRDHAREPSYDIDEETEFHDSEVDPMLCCHHRFQEQYRKEKAHDRST